jgi:hypothetical protein
MQEEDLIPAREFCRHHNIEVSFIHSLNEYGLVQVTIAQEEAFIPNSQLRDVEKFLRLHNELNINFEGIDVVSQLLEKIEAMQEEINTLKNRLRFFEVNE